MKCQNKECNGEICFIQSFEKKFRKRYRVLNYFCPLCGWARLCKVEITKKEFKIGEEKESKMYKI